MSTCAEVRDHLLTHGNRDRLPVYQHVVSCRDCEPFAERVMEVEGCVRSLGNVAVPDAWVARLLTRRELARRSLGASRASSELFVSTRPGFYRSSAAAVWSVLAHASCLLVGLALASYSAPEEPAPQASIRIHFYQPGGEGAGGGGGGGGNDGIFEPSASAPDVPNPARPAALAPRAPRPLAMDDVLSPELPEDVSRLLDGVSSSAAVDAPGIALDGPGGLDTSDTSASFGSGGGIGGGQGNGVGTGEGWGVGPGYGGGFGGGAYRPGAWDVDPVLITKGPEPVYPPKARENHVEGEVILLIRVRLDGTTEVVSVMKSLPYCVEAARAAARSYRWRPALKAGRPVEAMGVITVRFEMLAAR